MGEKYTYEGTVSLIFTMGVTASFNYIIVVTNCLENSNENILYTCIAHKGLRISRCTFTASIGCQVKIWLAYKNADSVLT